MRLVARVARQPGDLVGDVQPGRDSPEDGVLAVEPRTCFRRDDEELAPVRVRPGVRHCERAAVDPVLVELVLELVAGPAAAGPRRVAALDHEVGNDAVEDQAVVEAVARELDEVLDGLRSLVRVELDLDRAMVRMQRCVHRSVSASGSIACAVGSISPDSSFCAISRASCSASLSCSTSRTVLTAARTWPPECSSMSTVSSSDRAM